MLELAKECKNLLAMHHVSTVYVNAFLPKYGVIPEEVIPFPLNNASSIGELITRIEQMEPQVLEKEEENILKQHNFPNTYTFTKNLAE